MSTLSDEYIKNFSKERKALFNKRFRDDYDPNMSERSNIIRILNEMRELGLADGGRIGLKDGLPPKLRKLYERMLKHNDQPTTIDKSILRDLIEAIEGQGASPNYNIKEDLPKEVAVKDGGRIGLREGLGSFETSDPKDAMREVIERFLETNKTTVPITENLFLNLAPGISDVELGGIIEILGGELGLGASTDKDKGIGFSFKKEFNKGGRVAYQDGTPDRQLYETPVTDAIKSVNEKTIDAIQKGGELVDKYTGIDQITSTNFPGAFDEASGQPSDFRHQAASNLLAEALGKGKAGPIGYLSGAIGASGLGAIKEIGDLAVALYDNPKNYKDAFSEFVKDNVSNIKGAFAKDKTSQELYDELMAGYVPIDPFAIDRTSLLRSQQIFAQRKKALEDAKKKQEDIKKFIEQKDTTAPPKKPTKPITGITKPGTGGGGGRQVDTSRGAVRGAQQDISNYQDFGEVPLAKGGLARMLGE